MSTTPTELKQQAQASKHETYWAPGRGVYRCDDCDFSSQSLSEALEHQRPYALEQQKLDRIRAVAPELLEALRKMWNITIVAESGAILTSDQMAERRRAKRAAEEAIAKATGGAL